MNAKQYGTISDAYRIVAITVTTTATTLISLLRTASAQFALGRIVKVRLNPAAGVSIGDGHNSAFMLFSTALTIESLGVEEVLLKCAAGTVVVNVEIFTQE
jgi:hypothetical protein